MPVVFFFLKRTFLMNAPPLITLALAIQKGFDLQFHTGRIALGLSWGLFGATLLSLFLVC